MPHSNSRSKSHSRRSKSHSGEKQHNLSILAEVFGLAKPMGDALQRSTMALNNVTQKDRFVQQKLKDKYGYGGKRRKTKRTKKTKRTRRH